MASKLFNNTTGSRPRSQLRWAIFGIIVLFAITGFVDLLGQNNKAISTIDNGLSAVPAIRDFKMWPIWEKNPVDNSQRLAWKNVKEIDLASYGPYFHLGLDLLGGTQLIYSADVSKIPEAERADSISGVRDIIERRVNAMGVSEPLIQTNQVSGDWRVLVELAGVYDVNAAIKMIGETPLLEFKEENPAATRLTEEQQKQLDQMNFEVLQTAQNALDRIKQGGDFAALAKELSDDPGSKEQGGLYTEVKKGQFVPEFDEAVFGGSISSGEVYSELVKTVYGYHIIKLEALNGVGDGQTADVRHILFMTKTAADLGVDVQQEWLDTKLTGKQLKKARVEFDQTTGAAQVSLEFNEEGAKLFGEITTRNNGKPVAIFLDGEPISIPRVNEPILTGQAVISGNFTIQESKLLAQRLNAGALPVPINLISQTTVGATLGNESVQKSLFAGLLGLLFVAIFMILYYRLPGVLAVISLLIYTTIALFVFKMIPVTMTLAGIAGFILSIGMAVDANVLIFERLKEELRGGRELESAIREGFKRAWSSIRDSNISSLITCAILFWFGSSIIRGFAFTLAIGIIVSMFSAITITRQLLLLVAKWRVSKVRWLYRVKK